MEQEKLNLSEIALELSVAITTAVRNIRLYPPTSAIIGRSVDHTYSVLQQALGQFSPATFFESDNRLGFCDTSLGAAYQKKPQINTLIAMMIDLNIRRITFLPDLDKDELQAFLDLAGLPPQEFEAAGGIHRALAHEHVKHILLEPSTQIAKSTSTASSSSAAAQKIPSSSAQDEGLPGSVMPGANDKPLRQAMASVYERICMRMLNLCKDLINDYKLDQCLYILKPFSEIYHEGLKANKIYQSSSGNILKQVATQSVIELLVTEFETNEHFKMDQALGILVLFGELAIDPLLDLLLDSEDRYEREKILSAIIDIGIPAGPALGERITADAPWYYLRNLARLLGKVGTLDHLPLLKPLVTHPDLRVHKEALNSFYAIGDPQSAEVLLAALSDAENLYKINMITTLGALRCQAAGAPLLALLENTPTDAPKTMEKMREKICVALGRIHAVEALPVLEAIMAGKHGDQKSVMTAASSAVAMIKSQPAVSTKEPSKPKSEIAAPKTKAGDTPPSAAPAAAAPESIPAFADEREVDRLAAEGQSEGAVKILAELAIAAAKSRNFEEAERLNARLMDIDPMALSEIVRTNEAIEEEKQSAFDPADIELWADLYDQLTTEETNELYWSAREQRYDMGQKLITQGEPNDHLLFIREGRVDLVYTKANTVVLVKSMGPGAIIGQESFFEPTVSTVSAVANTRVLSQILPKSAVEKWRQTTGTLYPKLQEYCLKLEKVTDLIQKKGMDRRAHARFDVVGTMKAFMQNQAGEPVGSSIIGELSDIALTGLSFVLKTGNPDHAQVLMGRNIQMTYTLKIREVTHKLTKKGMVIGIEYHLKNEYAIRVRFDTPLDPALIGEIQGKPI